MASAILKYSIEELMNLVKTSPTLLRLSPLQREALQTEIPTMSQDRLIELFSILREERQFLDKVEEDYSKKFVKVMDDFVMDIKAHVYKIKHSRNNKIEENEQSAETVLEQELLKKLKKL